MHVAYRKINVVLITAILIIGMHPFGLVQHHFGMDIETPRKATSTSFGSGRITGVNGIERQASYITGDAVFMDCFVNGTIVIQNQSVVLFDNVTLVGDYYTKFVEGEFKPKGFMEVYDTAIVTIQNSTINIEDGAYIVIQDNSTLILRNVSTVGEPWDSLEIYISGGASLIIENSNTSLYIRAYDSSNITMISNDGSANIFLHNNTHISLSGKIMDFMYIQVRDCSRVEIDNVNNTDTASFSLDAYNNTLIAVSYTHLTLPTTERV